MQHYNLQLLRIALRRVEQGNEAIQGCESVVELKRTLRDLIADLEGARAMCADGEAAEAPSH
jgi:hypothetical protein